MGFLNMLTSPFGIKLEKGGPYPDAGKGDQMEGNVQQYMAQLAPLIAQIAQMSGVQNPMAPGGPQPENSDPYGLSPLQQASLNQEQGITADAYDSIMSKVRANLSARGMGHSSAVTAAEAYLQKQMQAQLGQERVQAGQNAYANKQGALQQIAQLMGTGFGAQQQVTDIQRQTAMQSSQNAMQQLGSLLGIGASAGGWLGGGKKAPGMPQGGVAGPVQGTMQPNEDAGWGPRPGIFDLINHNNWGSIYE